MTYPKPLPTLWGMSVYTNGLILTRTFQKKYYKKLIINTLTFYDYGKYKKD